MSEIIEYPSYDKYGVFKCLGCEHYLSGDHFDCKKDCPRTEKGTKQIICRQKHIQESLNKLEKEKQRLHQQYDELEKYMRFTRCPHHTVVYSKDCPDSCVYECFEAKETKPEKSQ